MDSDESIQVVVRVRPWNDTEKAAGTVPVVHTDNHSKAVSVVRRGERVKQTKYKGFKDVLTAFTSQREVYETSVRSLVEDVLLGLSCTAFAYGETGTGKSWTIEGDVSSSENWGLIPRSAVDIFNALSEEERFESSRVTVSYLEIYNEELSDLLLDPEVKEVERPKLRIVEDKSRGVFCMGLSELEVVSAEEVVELLQLAEERRRMEETRMNKKSSRSHCLFTVTVTAREILPGDGGMVNERTGRLHLVDLAGSESAKTGGSDSERGRERKSINQSLLALGRVITALQAVASSKDTSDLTGRVPYRESKLTRILQEALGGRSKTCIIATCSPSELAVDETVSTLSFAQRASGIRNKPSKQNQILSGSGRSLSPGAGLGIVGGASSQDWADMELRLAYMDTQVREAQYELARQHELQSEASTSALTAENKVTGLEDSVEAESAEVARQVSRVALLHNRLGKRHVHVKELRHLLCAHSETESALQVHARDLLRTLRGSMAQSEALHLSLEEATEDTETRRVASKAFFSHHDESLLQLRKRVGDFTLAEAEEHAAFTEDLATASAASSLAAQSLGGSVSDLEAGVAGKTTALAEAIVREVEANSEAAEELLDEAKTAADEAAVMVGQDAAGVDGRLVNIVRDVDASETSLLAWADSTAVAITANGEGLKARASREASNIHEAAASLKHNHEIARAARMDDTAAIETLLGGLEEHSAAGEAQGESAVAAAEAAAKAIESARSKFESAAEGLKTAVAAQREGQVDQVALGEIAAASAAIAEAASRQAQALASDAAVITETNAAIVSMVQEQKATQCALVKAVVSHVSSVLEEQTQILSTRLDAAVAVINERQATMAAANSALSSDIAKTFARLNETCLKSQATVERWSTSDVAAASAIDDSIAFVASAKDAAAEDALAVALQHKTSGTEAEDLLSRTSDETAAVLALKDSSLAATEAAVEAQAATAEAMDARVEAVLEWKEADEEATTVTLASIDALKNDVRADFLPRVQDSVTEARAALTGPLVSTLAEKLGENHLGLSSSVASRLDHWRKFSQTSRDCLIGEGSGLAPAVAVDCAAIRKDLKVASVTEVAAADAHSQRIAVMGQRASRLDDDVERLSQEIREGACTFAQEVGRVDEPVPLPPPLLPTVFSDAVASTEAHEDLLESLHAGNVQATETEMLERVAALLDSHQQAVTQGNLPFHEASEDETAEGIELNQLVVGN